MIRRSASAAVAAMAAACLMVSMVSPAQAQDERAALARRIAEARGLTELFDRQFAQQRDAAQEYVARVFDEAVLSTGKSPNEKEKAAMQKFIARAAEMFSGAEVAAAWSAQYGEKLSVQDLQVILDYYQSPAGRKDVAATQSAMPAFTVWMQQQSEARVTALLQDFMTELRAAKK